MSPPSLVSQFKLNHATARNLLRARDWARNAGIDNVRRAVAASMRPWSQQVTFTQWSGGVGATYAGTPERPGLGQAALSSVEDWAFNYGHYARTIHAKGTGLSISHGISLHGGSSDAECLARTGVLFDSDGQGASNTIVTELDAMDASYVLQRRFAKGVEKFHLEMPLASPLPVPEADERTRAEWKARVYRPQLGWIVGIFSELAGLECRLLDDQGRGSASYLGFDAAIDRLLQVTYVYCRREAGDPVPETVHHVGRALDWNALLDATEYTEEVKDSGGRGRTIPARRPATKKITADVPATTDAVESAMVSGAAEPATDPADMPPLAAGFEVAGWLHKRLSRGHWAVECPWAEGHSTGTPGDSSTVIFESGWWHCSHGSCRGRRTQADVFWALPETAREVVLKRSFATIPDSPDVAFERYVVEAAARSSVEDLGAFGVMNASMAAAGSEEAGRWLNIVRATRDDLEIDWSRVADRLAAHVEGAGSKEAFRPEVMEAAGELYVKSRGDYLALRDRLKASNVQVREWETAFKQARKARLRERVAPRTAVDEGRPTILDSTDLRRVADAAVAALAARMEIYQRNNLLVRVLRNDGDGEGLKRTPSAPRIEIVPEANLLELLSDAAVWVREASGEQGATLVPITPPDRIVRIVAERGTWLGLPPLAAVVENAVLAPDGTVVSTPGYHEATSILLLPNGPLPVVPDAPTLADAKEAAAVLLAPFKDFPFKGEEHKAALLAAILTLFARLAFYGPAPLMLVEANTPGTGKGLLVLIIALIALGRPMTLMPYVEHDDEMRKRITSLMLGGDIAVVLDNVAGALGLPSLDAALTAMEWSDRVLGLSQKVSGPLTITWFATVNDAVIKADTLRRSLVIGLETNEERPEERTDIEDPDLAGTVRANRARLAAAALTILRAYVVAGRPEVGLTHLGSFEAWSKLVRNAVVWIGMPDPLAPKKEWASRADRAGNALGLLLDGIRDLDTDGQGLTTEQIIITVSAESPSGNVARLRAALAEIVPTPAGRGMNPQVVGMKLAQLRRRVATCRDGRKRRLDSRTLHGFQVWFVEEVDPPAGDSSGGTGGTGGTSSAPGSTTPASSRGGAGGTGGTGGTSYTPNLPSLDSPRADAENDRDTREGARGGGRPPPPPSPPRAHPPTATGNNIE